MLNLIPEVKNVVVRNDEKFNFSRINFFLEKTSEDLLDEARIERIIRNKFWDYDGIELLFGKKEEYENTLQVGIQKGFSGQSLPDKIEADKLKEAGYALDIQNDVCSIVFTTNESLPNALSTLKQIFSRNTEEKTDSAADVCVGNISIFDYPSVEIRSISTTFAWYAGYGRIGFDSQLWGLEEWKEFINICSDFKINQLNLCMYGYWPFDFPEYPETCLRNIPLRIWNAESGNTIDILYTHPNLSNEFLTELIEYAHLLSIRIFTYIGLNSYNGGFSNIYKDKRMKLPKGSRYVNDFDSLCLSDPENIEYLKTSIRRILRLGLDGIIFEESEEAYWFCDCEVCRKEYVNTTDSAAEAKHEANYRLLEILHTVIKKENPACEVGLRAWREPPLVKQERYLKHCHESIPSDVCLYWAPGLYVPESEFTKWVDTFGRDRICARDTESNAWSSTQGRLIRIFTSNVLRCGTETNDQFIEKDIEQHSGSVKHGVRGINGYMFEWYGYFLHLLAHANYGWGATTDENAFYAKAVRRVLGDQEADNILYVLKNILTIHESQINLFPAEFPFLRNNVSEEDVAAIKEAIEKWPVIDRKLKKIITYCETHYEYKIYLKHFKKIQNSHFRNRHIYSLCLEAIKYDNEKDGSKKKAILEEIEKQNELDFDLVKQMYFDIFPVDRTGIKSCMYPYHELKRIIDNTLCRNTPPDENMIYLGVEALGWLWI